MGEFEIVTAVAVQSDGKILVSGFQDTDIFGNGNGILLIRYNPDGTLDETFGDHKRYTLYNKERVSRSGALVIQSDGKILVGGSLSGVFFLVRYLNDGTVDKSFGNEGAVITAFSAISGYVYINSIVIDKKTA